MKLANPLERAVDPDRKTVALVAFPDSLPQPLDLRLFEWLSSVFPVQFVTKSADDAGAVDGVVYFGQRPRDNSGPTLPSLTYLGNSDKEPAAIGTVVFGDDMATPQVLRRRSVAQQFCYRPKPLTLNGSHVVLASYGGQPLWATTRGASARADVTTAQLPIIDYYPSFFEYFNRDNFINLLPLVDFVRRLTGEDQWTQPPLRACFMFDDPNLHSTGYGFIDFPTLARHAEQCRYHVSFATIPLDGWFYSRRTAQLFREQKSRLSLLVHGNDHVQLELGAFGSNQDAIDSLAQALRRVERIEKRTEVEISRVMAAPFGACTEETMSVMARLGFEAACISPGSLRYHNSGCPWSNSLGLRTSEVIAGLPVLPRFTLSGRSKNSALLAAYLGQPIVPMAHHQDVANGLDQLADVAQFINSLGEVRWSDMTSIARSNILLRQEKDLLRVRPYSRKFRVMVPAGTTSVSVELPAGAFLNETVQIAVASGSKAIYSGPAGMPLAVAASTVLDVALQTPGALDPHSVPDRGLNFWAFARRQMTEGRDRLQPLFRRLGFFPANRRRSQSGSKRPEMTKTQTA